MTTKFYLRLWIFFIFCVICVFAFSFILFKTHSLKKEKDSIKQTTKLDSVLLLNKLNSKLDFLLESIEKIKLEEMILPASPFSRLIILQKNKIKSLYLESPHEIKQADVAQLQKIIDSSLPDTISSEKAINFKKIQNNDKNYLVFIPPASQDTQEIAFLKKNHDFFKWSSSNKTDIQFAVITKKNDVIFYNKNIDIF